MLFVNAKCKTVHFFDKNVSFSSLDKEKSTNFAVHIYSVENGKR